MDQNELIKKLRLSSKKAKPNTLFILSLEQKLRKESKKNSLGMLVGFNLRILLSAVALIIISSLIGVAVYNYSKFNSMVVKPELLASPTDGTLNLEKSLDTDGTAGAYLKKVGGEFLTADEAIPGTFLIKFKSDASKSEIDEYIASKKAKIIRSITELQIYTIELDDISINLANEEKPNFLEEVEQDKSIIVAATNDNSTHTDTDNDEYWNLKYLNLKPALDSIGSRVISNINVAIIDTGVCYDHEALKGRIGEGMDIFNPDQKPVDVNKHGCAVASVLPQVAPNVRIIPIKALNDKGIGSISTITQGIYESTKLKVSIINISAFGKTYSEIQNQVINFVTEKGIKIVASAGNDASTSNTYPAAYDKVISVGALDSNGKVSWFTNKSKTIDMYAPGSKIKVAHINGGYFVVSGSSFASVEVAGLLALEKSLCKVDGTINGKWNDCKKYDGESNYILNTAPKFTSTISKTEYTTGEKLEYKVTTEDEQADTIFLNVLEAPEGTKQDGFVIILESLKEGTFNFKLKASDGALSSEQVFTIKVTRPIVSNNPNPGAPQPIYDPSKETLNNPTFGKQPIINDYFIYAGEEYKQWKINNNYQLSCAATLFEMQSTKGNWDIWGCQDVGGYMIALQVNNTTGEQIPVKFVRGAGSTTFINYVNRITNANGWMYGFQDILNQMTARGYP